MPSERVMSQPSANVGAAIFCWAQAELQLWRLLPYISETASLLPGAPLPLKLCSSATICRSRRREADCKSAVN